ATRAEGGGRQLGQLFGLEFLSWFIQRRQSMATMFYDRDADLSLIQAKKVAVLGYGSQGHAHALNLRDSGVAVKVGLSPASRSRARAQAAGLEVDEVGAASKW